LASIHEMSKRISTLEEQNLLLMKKLKIETKPKWKPKANEINLQCKMTDNHKCDAIDLLVANSESSIRQVVDDEESNLEIEDVKEISIENQKSFFLPTNLDQLFPKLEKLSIIASRLIAIDNVKLSNLKNLKKLFLSKNEIKFISATDFAGLKNLQGLDLSFNNIADIEAGSFDELKSLEILNLQGNFLTKFNFKLLVETQNLN